MGQRTGKRTGEGGDGISRRDFMNGMLIAAGSAAMSSFPFKAFAAQGDLGYQAVDGAIGADPRVLRGGNLRSVFKVAHWMRDERLTFGASQITLAPAPPDGDSGTFPILADNGKYDVIIVGSGLAGLSAAFYIRNRRPGTRILILDGQPTFGGNSNRDDASPIPNIASTAGAYAVPPYADFQSEIYDAVGVRPEKHLVPDPFYNFFFDDRTPFANPGTRGWNIDTFMSGLASTPYPQQAVADLLAARDDIGNWYNTTGSPTDPADASDPQYDWLSQMTLADYLTGKKGYHPAVADFYTRYTIDALGGPSDQVNAYNSISFLGAEYNPLFAFPGGNSGIARHIVKWLIPEAIDGKSSEQIIHGRVHPDQLDDERHHVRIRQGAMVLRGDTAAKEASVVYHRDDRFYRARAKAVIFAGQGHTAVNCLGHLMSAAQQEAWESFVLAPVPVASVVLRQARPLVDLGLGYDQYWWGSKYWADFTVADWVDGRRRDPHRPVVLSFYGGNTAPPDKMAEERLKLLSTPFSSYEQSLREDMGRIFAGAPGPGFDFDRDVSNIYLYRWGHSMIYPTPGWVFGPLQQGGTTDRDQAPRRIFRKQLGRISIAGQDSESSPAVESALGSGLRTCLEVLPLL